MTTTERPVINNGELAVLKLIADGRTNEAIGRALGISHETVKSRTLSMYRKLPARDRAHAVSIGYRTGLLT